jgi:dienelactone hydrolase
VLLAAVAYQLLALAQPFFGDLRNLDDTQVKSHFPAPAYRSLDEWKAERTAIREQILVSAGLVPLPERNPLHARRTSRVRHGDFYIEKVVIEPLPGFHLAGNLYVPLKASATNKVPAVLVPHGHWKHGRAHQAPIYSVPALCVNLATQGYVAFAWDMVGYDDTRQLPHRFGESPAEQLWSFNALGIQLWDSMRALDFVQSLPEVDEHRVGVTGASGGGTQTFLLAAVDDRITAAAPVNMVSAIFQGDDICEEAPGLRVGINNMEIAAMMAPKPLLLVATTRDWTRNTPSEEFPAIRGIYALYGRPDQVAYSQIDAEHNYNRASRESVYKFFARTLRGVESTAPKETYLSAIPNQELVFGDRPEHLIGSLGFDQIFDSWKDAARQQTIAMSRKDLQDRMQATLGAEWPENVQTLLAAEQMLLTRGKGDRVPAQWMPKDGSDGKAVLVVNPDGSDAARHSAFVHAAQAQDTPVLLLDVYQTGLAHAPVIFRPGDQLTYHRTDDENRVQDILTGISWLHERSPRGVRLHCSGRASAWCLLAASVSHVPVTLDIEPIKPPTSDEELKRLVFIPGLQRAGGLRVAHLLVDPMGDLFITATDNNSPNSLK